MKTILITGATSGIGKATAELLAAGGNNLILTGRRLERLKKLQKNMIFQYNFFSKLFTILLFSCIRIVGKQFFFQMIFLQNVCVR